jgi:hypothetical protein
MGRPSHIGSGFCDRLDLKSSDCCILGVPEVAVPCYAEGDLLDKEWIAMMSDSAPVELHLSPVAEHAPEEGRRRVAILVVHGVGQQNRYDTLSNFAAGVMRVLKEQHPDAVRASRELIHLDGHDDSLIRLEAPGATIDIIEYYYQHKLQRQVAPEDVVDWLTETARRVRILYSTGDVVTNRRGAGPRETMQLPVGYLFSDKRLLAGLAALPIRVVGVMMPFLRGLSALHPIGHFLASLVIRPAYLLIWPLLRDFAGDVVAYTAYDPKLKLNHVRGETLGGCVAALKALLAFKDGDGRLAYDEVIVAGHSLGSVVAYDALSRLSNDIVGRHWQVPADDKRLSTLVTFGSPLDKIALLFWPLNLEQRCLMLPIRGSLQLWWQSLFGRGGQAEWQRLREEWREEQAKLQSSMVRHYHGLRALWIDVGDGRVPLPEPERALGHMEWLNFYHKRDLIAGHLDAFAGLENIEVHSPGDPAAPRFPEAHSYYWYSEKMYEKIIQRLVSRGQPPGGSGDEALLAAE